MLNKSENKDKCLSEKSLVDRYGTLHFAGQTHDKCWEMSSPLQKSCFEQDCAFCYSFGKQIISNLFWEKLFSGIFFKKTFARVSHKMGIFCTAFILVNCRNLFSALHHVTKIIRKDKIWLKNNLYLTIRPMTMKWQALCDLLLGLEGPWGQLLKRHGSVCRDNEQPLPSEYSAVANSQLWAGNAKNIQPRQCKLSFRWNWILQFSFCSRSFSALSSYQEKYLRFFTFNHFNHVPFAFRTP